MKTKCSRKPDTLSIKEFARDYALSPSGVQRQLNWVD